MNLHFSWDGGSEDTHSYDAITGTRLRQVKQDGRVVSRARLTVLAERNEGVGTRQCQYSTTFVGKFEQHHEGVLQMQFGCG
ncbi:MAG: hypothetical protein ACRD40_10600 [Candidatus Acidiferrales bacterium]